MHITNIARQLYDTLRELYEQIDHNENEKLKDGEFIFQEIKYSSEMQEKIREVLHDYEGCLSIAKEG